MLNMVTCKLSKDEVGVATKIKLKSTPNPTSMINTTMRNKDTSIIECEKVLPVAPELASTAAHQYGS